MATSANKTEITSGLGSSAGATSAGSVAIAASNGGRTRSSMPIARMMRAHATRIRTSTQIDMPLMTLLSPRALTGSRNTSYSLGK